MVVVPRRGLNVGAMSAEDDDHFLHNCYINTGTSEQIIGMASAKCIALGRTGSGKSAALLHIAHFKTNTQAISPESLSLNYISNSTIIRYLEDLGIDLDIFYQLLWRHVLVIELLKLKKQFHDEKTAKNWLQGVIDRFKPNPKRVRALEYLAKFGDSFWLDTEYRVREVVNRIEESIEKELGGKISDLLPQVLTEMTGKRTGRSAEEMVFTTEVINKAQQAANAVQLQELNEVIEFLSDDVFEDRMQHYYLTIDDLDTGWVHDNLRFKLVRALIETIKKFRKVRNVKIVISLRADLLETVLATTTAPGFQTEKYEDLMVRMDWSAIELKQMVDERVNLLFKDQYTGRKVSFEDVFPGKLGDVDAFTYMLHRSMWRPRDLISFINECLAESDAGQRIGTRSIRNAEAAYSRRRVRALADEWREAYGDLEIPFRILSTLSSRFEFRDVSDKILEDLCIHVLAGDDHNSGRFARECDTISHGGQDYRKLRRTFLEVMYVIGAIGYRRLKGSPIEWSFLNEPVLSYSAINEDTLFAIHPMLHKEFGIRGDASSFFS